MLATGSGKKVKQRQPRAHLDHEGQRTGRVDDGVRRIHDRGSQQHAHRVQIVGGFRHDVAGACALVVGVGECFQM